MLKNTEIAKLSRRYVVQTILAVVVLSLAVLSLQMFAHVDGLVPPLVVHCSPLWWSWPTYSYGKE